MKTTRQVLGFVLAFGIFLNGASSVLAADPSEIYERLGQHDEASAMRIDHRAWEAFLLNHVRPDGEGVHRLTYEKAKARDHEVLSDYIQAMSEVDIAGYARAEQTAYWINLYNALMVDLVLDNYPIPSIRMLERRGADRNSSPWKRPLVEVDGITLSLNDIENHILKKIWDDPRIHYAITCPALGCPNLQPVPYSGSQLEQQLSDAAMTYVNDPRCIKIDGGELHVSSLYRWNLRSFGGSERKVIQHLMAYAEPDLAMALQKFERLHGDHFDWRLNDASD